jgi:cob(I)alamin adenosyltransferase
MKIYTRRGDDGTTSLYSGERVPKASAEIELLGAVDEAQAALGVARAESIPDGWLDVLLIGLERDLWILMAEVATTPAGTTPAGTTSGEGDADAGGARERSSGAGRVDAAMIERLEREIDQAVERAGPPRGFAVPGESRIGALLDVARTVVRRAERLAVALGRTDSLLVVYLNRLSDLCWALARATEGDTRTNRGARTPGSAQTLVAADPEARGPDEEGTDTP